MDHAEFEDARALLRRGHVLDACADGPVGRTAVAERAGCSRTTAYRATTDLTERGHLERTAEGYRLTGTGAALLDRIRAFQADVDGVQQLGPLLDVVDAPALAPNASLFADADVHEADSAAPYAIEQELVSVIEGTEGEIFGVASHVGSPSTIEASAARVADGVGFELVLTRSAFEHFEANYEGIAGDTLDREHVRLFVVDDVTIDVLVWGETVTVVGFGDDGLVRTVATTDDDATRAWARDRFETHRDRGERVV